ncbi:hypothetical protein ANO11243_009950 [Dothideomycetidae sp. 11243]|nr:hypothetical protein ANO11243_009950 [fungal sp. No.11243]
MVYLLSTFKAVSLIFAGSAVLTGLQALLSPLSFARSFGLTVAPTKNASAATTRASPRDQLDNANVALAYVSLMGVRQLATGVTLMVFAFYGKWQEMAVILTILGVLVACTDGVLLYRAGLKGNAAFHAIPGLGIALLASMNISQAAATR